MPKWNIISFGEDWDTLNQEERHKRLDEIIAKLMENPDEIVPLGGEEDINLPTDEEKQ